MEKKVLITRKVDCSSISKDEFVRMMSEDLHNAVIEYDNYWKPIYAERCKKYIEDSRSSALKRATTYAEKKWKTECKRKEYIDNEMSKFTVHELWYDKLTFFDFDVEPRKNGISGSCCLHCNNISNSQLEKCFDEIKNNKYFKQALGWILEDHHNFRPQIILILPKNVQEEFDNDEKKLADDIARFYQGCRYWGD